MQNKQLLICDLDNTLYDWVSYFVPSFYAMIDATVELTGCDREKLLDDFRAVHQQHADSEHPFALLETDTIKRLFQNVPSKVALATLDPAFHAFNSARKRNLQLHPTVRETLEALNRSGIKLIAHTESKLYGVADRLTRLNLFQYFHRVYCRERSLTPHPRPQSGATWFGQLPSDKIVELSHHQTKPNPAVLLEICANEGFPVDEAAYIGDSVARDVLMAKRAKVFVIWAAYGDHHDPKLYSALVRISHWTSDEVARERRLKEEAKDVAPNYVALKSFSEVLIALGVNQESPRVARYQ